MLLPNKIPTSRVLAMPADCNSAGDIFGGWIMSQVDLAGSILAHQVTDGRVATVAVNEFVFQKPVFVGDVVSCFATVIKSGKTSITINIEVFSERDHCRKECVQVTNATLTYVAIDENREPRTFDIK